MKESRVESRGSGVKRKKVRSELDEPVWAVVAVGDVPATEITYAEAAELARQLGDERLTIVTAAAAARRGKYAGCSE